MTDEDKLNALLDRWEELAESEEQVDLQNLCADTPELLTEFLRRIRILTCMDGLLSNEGWQSTPNGTKTKQRHGQFSNEEAHAAISRIRAGRYVPVSFLAEGGLGRLFVARDTELNREVVLKLIKNETIADNETRRRFEFEAEITSQLDHPGIVPVYGFGRDDRSDGRKYPYYAMRLIRGQRLEDAIAEFHSMDRSESEYILELQKLLRCFLTVCETIAYAHSKGIIHRDLKPANIMLGEYGETLVVDWGLAKVINHSETADEETTRQVLPARIPTFEQTRAGSVKGTLAYMSPEQAMGKLEIVREASDIYSLGVVLYTLLTGTKAFPDRDEYRIHTNVIAGRFPRPRQIERRVSPALECICLKAMQTDPLHRYHTAGALRQDIERWLADEPVSAWREPWHYPLRRWCKRHSTALVSTAAAMTVAIFSLAIAASVLQETNRQLKQANNLAETHFEQAHNAVRDIVEQACGNPLLRTPGMRRAQESLLRVALDYYRDFTKQRSTDPRLQVEMLGARLAIARIVHDLRSPQEAQNEYQSVGAYLETLLKIRPDDSELRERRALVDSRLAQIDAELGKIQENRLHFERSDSIYQALVDQFPNDFRLRLDYANAVFLQGEATNDVQLLERARGLVEGRNNTESKFDDVAAILLGRIGNQIGLHEIRGARLADAAASLARANELVTKLRGSAAADTAEFETLRCSVDLNRARLAKLRGDNLNASILLESARDGFASLVRRDPEMGEFHLRLATTYLELGKLKLATADAASGIKELSFARDELNAQPNTDLRMLDRYERARSLLDLGDATLKAGEPDQARELFERSQREFESLVEIDNTNPDYHRNLAATWNQIAAMDQRSGDVAACAASLQRARAELQPIAERHPDRPEFGNALAKVYLNLGMVDLSQERWEDGWQWLRKARQIYDAEIVAHSDIVEYQLDRTQFLNRFIAVCDSRRTSLSNSNNRSEDRRALLTETLDALETLKQQSELSASMEELKMTVQQELDSMGPKTK